MENSNSVMHIATPKHAAAHQTQTQTLQEKDEPDFDYSQRSQWLRAAVLGANDGLVSVGSLMMGIGAVKTDVKSMILTGFAGLVAGASSMAIGEFVSVYSQLDIEVAQLKRETKTHNMSSTTGNGEMMIINEDIEGGISKKEKLPNPLMAALASALAFALGALVPLLAAALVGDHKVRLYTTIAAVSLALVVFGWIGAKLGNSSIIKSCGRVLVGGWMAMAITFGLTKSISAGELQM